MSCNGCRVLRKGCSESCILRTCLEWIENAEAQANATLFIAKFFGRADLMSFISAVPNHQRPALFQSLLFEACGRTVNPVNGAVGLLSSGNWHICQAAVNTVLRGGILRPIPHELLARAVTPMTRAITTDSIPNMYGMSYKIVGNSTSMLLHPSYEEVQRGRETTPFGSETSATTTTSFENTGENDGNAHGVGVRQKRKLLNLFV